MQQQAAELQALLESSDDDSEETGAVRNEVVSDAFCAKLDGNGKRDARPIYTPEGHHLDPQSIAEQIDLLTDKWMLPGTMQESICKYGIKLFCKDVVSSIVESTFVVLDETNRLRREKEVRWVKLARELCRIDHLMNPPSRIPASLNARMMARKQRRGQQQEEVKRSQIEQDGTISTKKNAARDKAAELNKRRTDDRTKFERLDTLKKSGAPVGNLAARAHQRQIKIMQEYIQDFTPPPQTEDKLQLMRIAPMQILREPPRMPKSLESTYATYARSSRRPKRSTKSGAPRPPRSDSVLATIERNFGTTLSPDVDNPLSKTAQPHGNQMVRLPRLNTGEQGKENRMSASRSRSASADPGIRTYSDVPSITKRLQPSGSGIFKPDLRALAGHPQAQLLAGSKSRPCMPASGVSICPIADGQESLPEDKYSDSYESDDGGQVLSRPSSGATLGIEMKSSWNC